MAGETTTYDPLDIQRYLGATITATPRTRGKDIGKRAQRRTEAQKELDETLAGLLRRLGDRDVQSLTETEAEMLMEHLAAADKAWAEMVELPS